MAHNIEKNDKQQGIKQAWHGLSEVMPEITLENNWLKQWEIAPVPLFYAADKPAGFSMLQCSDNPEITIGQPFNPETFKPISNGDFLALVEKSISGTAHKIASVGSIRNRGRVFLSVELQGMSAFKAAGRDFSAFLNYGNGHDKSSVLWVNTSNVCTVCDNTFSMNLFSVENKRNDGKNDISLRTRHTKNVTLKFPAMADLIDRAVGVQAEFALALESMAGIPVAVDKAREIFAGFIAPVDAEKLSTRAENTVDRLVSLFNGGAGNKGENLADVFNAATDYFTHESSGGENKQKQFVSSEFGSGNIRKGEIFNLLSNGGDRLTNTAKRGQTLLAAAN